MIRPGMAVFDPISILAVISMLLAAGQDLATRGLSASVPSTPGVK